MTVAFDSLRRRAAITIAIVVTAIGAACTESDVHTEDIRDPIVGTESTQATTSTPAITSPATTARVTPSATQILTASTIATTSTISSTTTSTFGPPSVTTTTVAPAPVRPGKLLGGWAAADEPLFFVSDDPAWRLETFSSGQGQGWSGSQGGVDMVLIGEGTIPDSPVATLQVGPLGAYRPAGLTEPVRVGDVDAMGIVGVSSGVLVSGVEWPAPDGYVASLYGTGLDLGTVVVLANHVHFEGTQPVFDPISGFRSVELPAALGRGASADFVSDETVVSVTCQNSGEVGLELESNESHTVRSVAGVVLAQRIEPRPEDWSTMNGALWSVGGWWCSVWTYAIGPDGEGTGAQVPDDVVDGLLSTLTIVDEQTVREQAVSVTIQATDGGGAHAKPEDGVFVVPPGFDTGTARLTSDGTLLIMLSRDALRVIDVASGRTLGEYDVDLAAGVPVLTDDDRLFFDGASVRTLATGALVARIAPEGFYGGCATFSDDGRLIALANSLQVTVYEVATGDKRALSPPPDEAGLVTGCADFVGTSARAFATFSLPTCCGAPPGSTGVARIWDLASGRRLLSVELLGPYSSAWLSPDDRYVVVGEASDARQYGRLVDAVTGDVELELPRAVRAFSNDGTRFAITPAQGSSDFEVWDARTLTKLATIPGHSFGTFGPDNFSPDATRVISLVDGVAEVRDIASGDLVGRLQLDGDVRMSSARYSRDGSSIISGNTDGTVRIWPAP